MGMKQTKKNPKWPPQKTEFFNFPNSQYFQICQGLGLGLVGLIDAKYIDVAQPIWL